MVSGESKTQALQAVKTITSPENPVICITYAARKPLIELPQFLKSKYDFTIYKGRNEGLPNRAPAQVEDALRNSKPHELFEFEGWMWYRFVHREPKGLLKAMYKRNMYVPTSAIMEKLAPYFDNLEGLVRKNILAKEALPPFEHSKDYDWFKIPGTNFVLEFEEKEISLERSVSIQVEAILGGGPMTDTGRALLTTPATEVAEFSYRLA